MNTITYMTGLLTFYLKGQISTDQNFLRLRIPNTILALIPLGAQNHNVPVNQVASVASSFHLEFKNFIVGIIEAGIAFACFGESFLLGLILLLLGANTIINSFYTVLNIDTTAGKSYTVSFLIFEKAKAYQAEELIGRMIAGRLNDTNNRQVAEAQTNAIVNAINNQGR